MKRKSSTIKGNFSRFLEASRKSEWVKHPYANDEYGQKEKEEITISLILWKFLREFSRNSGLEGWTEKRKFIADFLANNPLAKEHNLVRIVAKVEALPTTIWRKLLWRENIDFSGYEPCLRRLSNEQKDAIENCYAELFSNEKPATPSVLKKSWRDRVKIFFGIMSSDKLLKDHYNDNIRNQSKGAYAFSLLGLDFGFSLYPYGDDNDQKITNQKYTRFFSVKAHINDFIVNKEDGKYWWLYKTARSNYAFSPNKKIEMKKHVCPGFWLTLIIQTLFWIVSPVALAITGLFIAKYGFVPTALIPASFAFTMIIWAIAAILRTIRNLFKHYVKDYKVFEVIGITVFVVAVSICALVFAGYIIYGIGGAIGGLAPIVGPLLSAAFILSGVFYVFFLFTCVLKDEPLFKYSDIPVFVRYILHLSIGGFVIVLFDKYVSMLAIDLIVSIAQSFWEWYTSDLLLSNWFIFSLVFFGLFVYFYTLFLNDEERFAGLEKTFTWLTKGFVGISLIIFAIASTRDGTFNPLDMDLATTTSLSFVFLAAGFAIIMIDYVNKSNIEERQQYAITLHEINAELGGMSRKNFIHRMMNSKWLAQLNDEEKWSTIDTIRSLSFTYFDSYSYDRLEFTNLMATKGSVEITGNLLKNSSLITRIKADRQERYALVQMIINGKTFAEAVKLMEQKRLAANKAAERAKTIFSAMLFPFIKFAEGLTWFFQKIGQFFGTLKDLWDFFNKRCPFVTEARYLD